MDLDHNENPFLELVERKELVECGPISKREFKHWKLDVFYYLSQPLSLKDFNYLIIMFLFISFRYNKWNDLNDKANENTKKNCDYSRNNHW